MRPANVCGATMHAEDCLSVAARNSAKLMTACGMYTGCLYSSKCSPAQGVMFSFSSSSPKEMAGTPL